jgi:hypothetical protein
MHPGVIYKYSIYIYMYIYIYMLCTKEIWLEGFVNSQFDIHLLYPCMYMSPYPCSFLLSSMLVCCAFFGYGHIWLKLNSYMLFFVSLDFIIFLGMVLKGGRNILNLYCIRTHTISNNSNLGGGWQLEWELWNCCVSTFNPNCSLISLSTLYNRLICHWILTTTLSIFLCFLQCKHPFLLLEGKP